MQTNDLRKLLDRLREDAKFLDEYRALAAQQAIMHGKINAGLDQLVTRVQDDIARAGALLDGDAL